MPFQILFHGPNASHIALTFFAQPLIKSQGSQRQDSSQVLFRMRQCVCGIDH